MKRSTLRFYLSCNLNSNKKDFTNYIIYVTARFGWQVLVLDSRCDSRYYKITNLHDFTKICQMSVVTAVILGSLLCGLLLVIAAGCGLRLYHLRLALEQRWAAIRQQHHIIKYAHFRSLLLIYIIKLKRFL